MYQMGRIFRPTPESRLPTPEKVLPSFPRRGGPRLSVVGWFGAAGTSLADRLHPSSPSSVCGIGASPMTRRRGELRSFGEGSASAGSGGRSVIGRRPDATRGREVKSEG